MMHSALVTLKAAWFKIGPKDNVVQGHNHWFLHVYIFLYGRVETNIRLLDK